MDSEEHHVVIIGAGGTIGLPLCAFHLLHLSSPAQLTVVDPPRPDLRERLTSYLNRVLLLPASPPYQQQQQRQIELVRVATSIPDAVQNATIVQEAGPEDLEWKSSLWAEVKCHAPKRCLLWSTTSGIPASAQNARMQDKTRLIVAHVFNPPHILPLVELVPSPTTSEEITSRTVAWWRARGRDPIVLKREIPGFVAGRLAWALLREAISLVDQGVVGVDEVDRAIEDSMGVRWAYQGPFKSFHAGGGEGGLEGLSTNVGGTVQKVWDDLGMVNFGGGKWEKEVYRQCMDKYGMVDEGWLLARDKANKRVLEVVRKEPREKEDH